VSGDRKERTAVAIQLVLHRSAPAPASRIRIVWQGFVTGDSVEAVWVDRTGEQRWSGTSGLRWLQRDAMRPGEQWKVNLLAVPADIARIGLQITRSGGGTIGVAVMPLPGNQDDTIVHPGAELVAGQTRAVLELSRMAANEWAITAISTSVNRDDESSGSDAARPAARAKQSDPEGWGPEPLSEGSSFDRPKLDAPSSSDTAATRISGTSGQDHGPSVPIPAALQSAVDAARATGAIHRRQVVDAVVDTSASMRPWMVSGQLGMVLKAVQAVAGASSRPTVSAQFLPSASELAVGRSIELKLDSSPDEALAEQLAATGLRTGNRRALLATARKGAARPGLHLVITDDVLVARELGSGTVTVLLGDGPLGQSLPGWTVHLPPNSLDVRSLARDVALAAAAADAERDLR
jgi:hypothetical protein